jgi:hypothetical protein
MKKGTYESNFKGVPGVPGNPILQELGKSSSMKPGLTKLQQQRMIKGSSLIQMR